MDFSTLPPEMLEMLFDYLHPVDLLSVRLVCRSWNTVQQDMCFAKTQLVILPIRSRLTPLLLKFTRKCMASQSSSQSADDTPPRQILRYTLNFNDLHHRQLIINNLFLRIYPHLSQVIVIQPAHIERYRFCSLLRRIPSLSMVKLFFYSTPNMRIEPMLLGILSGLPRPLKHLSINCYRGDRRKSSITALDGNEYTIYHRASLKQLEEFYVTGYTSLELVDILQRIKVKRLGIVHESIVNCKEQLNVLSETKRKELTHLNFGPNGNDPTTELDEELVSYIRQKCPSVVYLNGVRM